MIITITRGKGKGKDMVAASVTKIVPYSVDHNTVMAHFEEGQRRSIWRGG